MEGGDLMDLVKLEKDVAEYLKAKQNKNKIELKVTQLRKKIVKVLQNNKKRQIKLNDYSVELKVRKTRQFNREKIFDMVLHGQLPKDILLQETETVQLFVNSSKDIELVGNKFIIKRKN